MTMPPSTCKYRAMCEVFVIWYNVRRSSVSLFDTERYIVKSVIYYTIKKFSIINNDY